MFCINCGKQLNPGTKFCTTCGARQDDVTAQQIPATQPVAPQPTTAYRPQPTPQYQPVTPQYASGPIAGEQRKWFDNPVVILVSLLFCFPVGLYFLWAGKSFKQPWKIGLTTAVAVLTVIVAMTPPAEKSKQNTRQVKPIKADKSVSDKDMGKIRAAIRKTFDELDADPPVHDWDHIKKYESVQQNVHKSITDTVILTAIQMYGSDYAENMPRKVIEKIVWDEMKTRMAGNVPQPPKRVRVTKLPELPEKVIAALKSQPENEWYIEEADACNASGCNSITGTSSKGYFVHININDGVFEDIKMSAMVMNPGLVLRDFSSAHEDDQAAYKMLVKLAAIFDSEKAEQTIQQYLGEISGGGAVETQICGDLGCMKMSQDGGNINIVMTPE